MNICKTPIPGMVELSGVSYSMNQGDYDKAMTPAKLKGCSMVIASLTTAQTDAAKFLLKNGFKQVGGAKHNPNSGHMILLFSKKVNAK